MTDEYHWLRDTSDPDTLRYIAAENEYTDEMIKGFARLRDAVYEELEGRLSDQEPVPTKVDDYYYYEKTEPGLQHSILCRRKVDGGSREEVVLDQNVVASGHDFFTVGTLKVSPDHRLVAFAADTTGSELYDLLVLDIATKKLMDEQIREIGTFEWGADNRTIFYVKHDEMHRPYKVLRHALGTSTVDDVEVHHEHDLRCEYLVLTKTKSRKYILATGQTLHTSEVSYIQSDDSTNGFRVVLPRKEMIKYYVEHVAGDHFLIITNDEAPNYRIVRAPVHDTSKENWTDVVPHRPSTIINISDPYPWVEAFEDHIAVFERENALTSISVYDVKTGEGHRIALPEQLRSVTPLKNPDVPSQRVRFSYSSFLTPRTMCEYDMETRELHTLQQEVVNGYDKDNYHSERIFATADDGTSIPITLVHRTDIKKDGSNPLLLYGYGSAGDFESSMPVFDNRILSLLDRGGVYAVAGIRGGGEMGRHWYDDGRVLRKKNSFTDFIRCAEHLIGKGYTSNERLAIIGGSAGGLLVATVMNMRPDLFRAVVAEVPFVDVIHTMLDKSIPLVIGDSEEYGDPAIPEQYWYCKSFSPYENVAEREYPDLLVKSAMNDPRVPFWEPVKWVARLRDRSRGSNIILLRTEMNQGHLGVSARYDALGYDATKLAFIFDRLGIPQR